MSYLKEVEVNVTLRDTKKCLFRAVQKISEGRIIETYYSTKDLHNTGIINWINGDEK